MKNTLKLGSLALVLVMATTVMLSGTFAKYTSTLSGADTALVARWELTAKSDNTSLTADGTNRLDIFKHDYTVYLNEKGDSTNVIYTKVTEDGVLATNTAANTYYIFSGTAGQENDTTKYTACSGPHDAKGCANAADKAKAHYIKAQGTSNYIIAPGIEDSFDVTISYDGDVDSMISLELERIGNRKNNIPIQYAVEKDAKTFSWDDPTTYDLYYSEHLLAEGVLEKMAGTNVLGTAPNDQKVLPAKSVVLNNSLANTDMLDSPLFDRTDATGTTAGQNTVIFTRTVAPGATEIDKNTKTVKVYWRWPYDVSKHDNAQIANAGIEKLIPNTASGFDPVVFRSVDATENWSDRLDTFIGQSSQASDLTANIIRDTYGLRIKVTGTQITPKVVTAP